MMLSYEKVLYAQGVELIAGVDEVGRGPLARAGGSRICYLTKVLQIKKASMTVKKSQNQNMKPFISR